MITCFLSILFTKGDSGGPLIARANNHPNQFLQTGIVSFGSGSCDGLRAFFFHF